MALFYSPHAAFRALIREQRDRRHPTTGDIIETEHALWADFGQLGQEYHFRNPETGEEQRSAHIIGHYYDTDAMAAEKGWDQETHDLVIRRLRDLAKKQPEVVREEIREKPKAVAPWPTYDQATPDQILELAPALGLVQQALAYERENRDRPHVTAGLNALLGAVLPVEDDGPDEEPEAVSGPVKAAEPVVSGGTISL